MKKLSGLDKYVIFSMFVTLVYTIAEFITATITGVEKSTLTMAVYGFWAGEIISAAVIKIFKLRGTDDNTLADPRNDCPDLQCGGDDMADSHDYQVGD